MGSLLALLALGASLNQQKPGDAMLAIKGIYGKEKMPEQILNRDSKSIYRKGSLSGPFSISSLVRIWACFCAYGFPMFGISEDWTINASFLLI